MKNFIKGLLTALIAWLAAYFGSAQTFNLVYVAVYVAGFTAIYLAKNAVLPSISILGTIDLRDILSGIILAIGGGVSDLAAQILSGTSFSWPTLWHTVIISVGAYLATKFGFGQKQPA